MKLVHLVTFVIIGVVSFSVSAELKRHTEYPTYFTHANGISIAYQDFAPEKLETILLVMGLGGQLIHWDDEFVMDLVNAGYRVIRYDNRDVGLSQKFLDAPTPGVFSLIKYKLGLSTNAPYKLNDMAADAIGLLDQLEIKQAHIVGISMGGMIAQILAADYPGRVQSLTSIMSTSGASHLPQGSAQLDFRDRSDLSREEIIQQSIEMFKPIFGGNIDLSDEELYQSYARAYDRMSYDDGFSRQLWAIIDSPDRVELLKTIQKPTVVIHGKEDPLVPYVAGEHTAQLVSGSKLVLIDGMGHRIDRQSRPKVVQEILEVMKRAS